MKSHTFYTRLKQAIQEDLGPMTKSLDTSTFASCASSNFKLSLLKKATDDVEDKTKRAMVRFLLEQSAVSAFEDAEDACKRQNYIFSNSLAGLSVPTVQVLLLAQQKIESLFKDIGNVRLFAECHHGPGVTATIKKDRLGLDTKYDESRTSVTSAALPLLQAVTMGRGWAIAKGAINPDDLWGPASLTRDNFIAVEHDTIMFVPKSATSLRTISVGPTGNVYLQLGIGRALQHALKRVGIDLKDQNLNSDLARWGSKSNHLATMDLKQASARLSRALIRWLFPARICHFMDMCRVNYYRKEDGSIVPYQQYSGMGNGFTFPMQTAVFYSLAWACCVVTGTNSTWVSTYGDDIIVPVDAYQRLAETLTDIGSIVNETKSFVDGPFRESCGGQWYLGQDVRPVYWKGFKAPDAITAREVAMLDHSLWLWEDRVGQPSGLSLKHTHELLRSIVYRLDAKVPVVPMNAPVGSGLVSRFCALDGWSGRKFVFVPLRRAGRQHGLYCSALNDMQMSAAPDSFGATAEPVQLANLAQPSKDDFDMSENSLTQRGSGFWTVRRTRLLLGKYPT